jgi:hypothetical protein
LTLSLTSRTGPLNARVWAWTWLNNGPGGAFAPKLTNLTLQQVGGAACTPVIAPAQFPVSGTDMPSQGGTSTAAVTIDFTGCASNTRFKAVAPFTANGGAVQGTQTLSNLFP